MPCMKEPYKNEAAARKAMNRIRQNRRRLNSQGRRRAGFERNVYPCDECHDQRGKPLFHLTKSGRIIK